MATQPYPPPSIPLFVARINKALSGLAPPDVYNLYQQAASRCFSQQNPHYKSMEAVAASLKSNPDVEDETNWEEVWFIDLLLKVSRAPTANSMLLAFHLSPPPNGSRLQNFVAASLLHSVAVVSIKGTDGFSQSQIQMKRQLRGLLATFRLPGPEKDSFFRVPLQSAQHAVVWKASRAWKIQIIDHGVALSIAAIDRQLDMIGSSSGEENHVAAMSWRLNRSAWHQACQDLKAIPSNAPAFEALYSSLVTLALEDYCAPLQENELLSDVRGGHRSPNRFSDQMMGIVVYKDGEVGMSFDHIPVDCGAAIEMISLMYNVLRQPGSIVDPAAETITDIEPSQLNFDIPFEVQLDPLYVDEIPRLVVNISLSNSAIISANRLVDALLNFSFQYAIFKTRVGDEQSVAPLPLVIFQPVWQRAFLDGRCEPCWPVTIESTSLLHNFISFSPEVNAKETSMSTRVKLLTAALEQRRLLIKAAAQGQASQAFSQGYLIPHLSSLLTTLRQQNEDPETIADIQMVLDTWTRYMGPSRTSHFTGFTVSEGNEQFRAGMSNIYLPDQLICFYLSNQASNNITICASGRYTSKIDEIALAFKEGYEVLLPVFESYTRSKEVNN